MAKELMSNGPLPAVEERRKIVERSRLVVARARALLARLEQPVGNPAVPPVDCGGRDLLPWVARAVLWGQGDGDRCTER